MRRYICAEYGGSEVPEVFEGKEIGVNLEETESFEWDRVKVNAL